MDVNFVHIYSKKIKILLVFFCVSLFLTGCKDETTIADVLVYYDENVAVSVSFIGEEAIDYQVVRKSHENIAILGGYSYDNERITFTPVIPFSYQNTYLIKYKNRVIGTFTVKDKAISKPPKLVHIHPQIDSVPENLLKMYFVFSKPMQEVKSALDFINVINTNTGKKVSIFLPLQTELWNTNHTELTLWLDPGRIKKDLIPNQELGIPIKEGNTYEIIVSPTWSDTQGNSIGKEYRKKIVVMGRDTKIPSTNMWTLTVPKVNSKEALGISFGEVLDAMLLEKDIHIMDINGQKIEGGFLIMKNAESALYIPKKVWEPGKYSLIIQSALEDLAGNNMNRLFDTDLHKKQLLKPTKTKEISFTIR
ncbi:MAG: hypothetical protein JXQ93_10265 [Flavobacteriaceae bacterium]